MKEIKLNEYWTGMYQHVESCVEDFVVLFEFWKGGDATEEETKIAYDQAMVAIEDAEFENVNNCDSSHTVNLTVNESSFVTDVHVACDSFTWIDGITYTESTNSITDTLLNVLGCDSIVTLDLTIYYSDSTFSNITVCDAFVWGDSTYTESGVYTHEFVNVNGCDSIIETTFTVLSENFVSNLFAICNGDSVLAGGLYQTTTGLYYDTLVDANGCNLIIETD